jgi:hypothetical protein
MDSVVQLGRSCKRLRIVMKDDSIWRSLYYQRYVGEEDRRMGIGPVLVDDGLRIYCKHLNMCGCKKYDDDRYDYHDYYYVPDSDDDDYGEFGDRRYSKYEYDPDNEYHLYDRYYYADYSQEDCGLFLTWWSLFWAEVKYRKSREDYYREMERFFESFGDSMAVAE